MGEGVWVGEGMAPVLLVKISISQSYTITVEPLNVDSLKKGHHLYSGHFVWLT